MTIRLATESDFAAVAAVRLAAYRAVPEFSIADEAAVTRWDGQVLVAECPETGLVATMQVIECNTAAERQEHSGSTPPPQFFRLIPPCSSTGGPPCPAAITRA